MVICKKYNLKIGKALGTNLCLRKQEKNYPEFIHDYSDKRQRSQPWEKDKSAYRKDKILFLVRDPRDVIVSHYFQLKFRAKRYNGSISEFIRDEKRGITKILYFYNIWYENKDIPSDFLLVKYEDLHRNCFKVMKSIWKFFDLSKINDEIIKDAIAESSFKNMQRIEKEGKIKDRSFGVIDVNDNRTFKVREGKINGYINHLNRDDINYINDQMIKMDCKFYCV